MRQLRRILYWCALAALLLLVTFVLLGWYLPTRPALRQLLLRWQLEGGGGLRAAILWLASLITMRNRGALLFCLSAPLLMLLFAPLKRRIFSYTENHYPHSAPPKQGLDGLFPGSQDQDHR